MRALGVRRWGEIELGPEPIVAPAEVDAATQAALDRAERERSALEVMLYASGTDPEVVHAALAHGRAK